MDMHLKLLCRVRQKQSRVVADEEDDPYGGSTDEENGEVGIKEEGGRKETGRKGEREREGVSG